MARFSVMGRFSSLGTRAVFIVRGPGAFFEDSGYVPSLEFRGMGLSSLM